MKTLTLFASATAFAAFATLAAAAPPPGGVQGTVTLTGKVSDSCVVDEGQGASSTFAKIIPLGELDQANGTLRSDLQASTSASPSASFQTQIICNTATPKVELTNSQLIDGALTPVPAGYANAINYTANAVVTETTGSDTFTVTTNGATDGHTGPTAVSNPIANSPNNVTINAYAFNTVGGNTNILLSSGGVEAYQGVITLNITPN